MALFLIVLLILLLIVLLIVHSCNCNKETPLVPELLSGQVKEWLIVAFMTKEDPVLGLFVSFGEKLFLFLSLIVHFNSFIYGFQDASDLFV